MSMVKQLYSINGLATELDRDRRTIAKALRDVRPDGILPGGHRGWFLKTALKAIKAAERQRHVGSGGEKQLAPKAPASLAALKKIENPVDQGVVIGLLVSVYRVGRLAAAMAVGAGAPMKAAYTLKRMMSAAAALGAEEICRELNLDLGSELTFDPDAFEEADWAALAELAGEPMDLPAWEAWAHQRCGIRKGAESPAP